MAFPLKSGADLYNQQLIRAAIWNHGADPSETVTGLLYFNTSNSSAAKKLRLHTGTEWKTLAFEEDLDVANNAEFKALEDKVKLLAGEVDTDAIISNMKEVSNFLAGFAEDAKLMDVLSNVPKALFTNDLNPLNYTSRPLFITAFRTGEGTTADYGTLIVPTWSGNQAGKYYLSELRFPLGVAPQFRTSFNGEASDWRTIAFTSDLENYLPLTGGVIESTNGNTPLSINGGGDWVGIGYFNNNSILGYLGIWNDHRLVFIDESWNVHTLLHSGNIGEYNAGGAEKLVGTYHGSEDASSNPYFWLNESGKTRYYLQAYNGNLCLGPTEQSLVINSSGNVNIGASDLAGTSAKLYVDGCLTLGGVTQLNKPQIKFFHSGDYFDLTGNFVFGANSGSWSIFNESSLYTLFRVMKNGNVGIGLTNPSAQLHVAQDIVANGTIACKGIAAEGDAMDMVDKTVLHIIPNGPQQTFTLNHGLGTREITISIYEITSMGTNMILTDVEIVDDNNISVSFGNPPTENHMVVVMG